MQLQPLECADPSDLDGAFGAAATGGRRRGLVLEDSALASHHATASSSSRPDRLPAMYGIAEYVAAGGLMAYGPNLRRHDRRAAYYVDRILKGAKPADLPVEQPMTFDFVVNLKTAQALGITFPNEIMLQVTEILQ